jgi:DNA mismatch repair ATPase MutS
MLVEERTVDDRPRLEFKYKIRSGPSTITSYGLALARCLRFPSTLIDRAEEIADQVDEDSMIDITGCNTKDNRKTFDDSEAMEVDDPNESSSVSEEMTALDTDVIDLYSYILLMMTHQEQQSEVDTVNQKLENLIGKMSLEFKEMIKNSSLDEIIGVLNATRSSDG